MEYFGQKMGQDLGNRAAHPYQKFRGVPTPPPPSSKMYPLPERKGDFHTLFQSQRGKKNTLLSGTYPYRQDKTRLYLGVPPGHWVLFQRAANRGVVTHDRPADYRDEEKSTKKQKHGRNLNAVYPRHTA